MHTKNGLFFCSFFREKITLVINQHLLQGMNVQTFSLISSGGSTPISSISLQNVPTPSLSLYLISRSNASSNISRSNLASGVSKYLSINWKAKQWFWCIILIYIYKNITKVNNKEMTQWQERQTTIALRGSRNTPCHFMLQKLNSSKMG